MLINIVSVSTIITLILLSAEDLKERMIVSSPVTVLSAAWVIRSYSLYRENTFFLMSAWAVVFMIFISFRVFHIWGDGDSDMFLLFSGVVLCIFRPLTVGEYVFFLSVTLAVSLVLSLLTGAVEAAVRKKKLDMHSGVAVVPGLSMGMIFMITVSTLQEVGIL